MSQFAAILFLVFFFKLLAIGLGTRTIMKKYPDLLGSILGAWLLSQCFLILWMLVLSTFHGLTTLGVWAGLAVLNLIFLSFIIGEKESPTPRFTALKLRKTVIPAKAGIHPESSSESSTEMANRLRGDDSSMKVKLRLSDYKIFFSSSGLMAILAAAGVFFILAYRSLYFFDNTWDAITYGLTRIEFYAHYHSLFVIQPTKAVNIFSNEWNGELNALFYLLAAAKDQASSFANVEIWLFSFLGYSWLCGLLGVPARLRLLVGLVLSTTPVLLGLTMTVKGDLLAIMSFALALGFTLRAIAPEDSQRNPFDLLFAFAALGLANGAKIIVLPYVGLIVLFLGFTGLFLQRRKKYWLVMLASLALFSIGNSRFIINYFSYGDCFKHLESTTPAFVNIINNLKGIVSVGSSAPYLVSQMQHTHNVLDYGFGFLVPPLLLWFCLGLGIKAKRFFYQRKITVNLLQPSLLMILFLGVGFCFLLITLPWYPWSFRYFCPYLMLMAAFILAWPYRNLSLSPPRQHFQNIGVLSLLLIVIANAFFVFLPLGEAFPVQFSVAMAQSEMERKVALHPYLWSDLNGLEGINLGKIKQATILLFNEIDSAVLPFFGENHQNNVELVDSLTSFKEKAATMKYDFAVISAPPANRPLDMNLPGYAQRGTTNFWTIYTPLTDS